MNAETHPGPFYSPSRFVALVRPKEHGSWSLALEPLVLGLIAAPSVGGGWFGVAVLAAFFARRPLRIALRDPNAETLAEARVPTCACGLAALLALAIAVSVTDARWLVWLIPSALAGAVFLFFDLRNEGRAEIAEVAGAASFACLPAVFAIIAGWGDGAAIVLSLLMLARAVPAVLGVRACLRAKKTGEWKTAAALTAATFALAGVAGLWRNGFLPTTALALVLILTARTLALLVYPRVLIRARTLGMAEAVLGLLYVVITGAVMA